MRYEIKIPINKFYQSNYTKWLNSKIRKTFPDREINSLYYDTEKLNIRH